MTIQAFDWEGVEFLLAVVHFPSKRNWSDDDQLMEAVNLGDEICRSEKDRGHARTILMGDINMNPFDRGVVGARGLNAVMTQEIARNKSRTVQGREYKFFYNPMWGFFGDRTQGPPGTHYYRSPGHVSYEWNMFDQVLLRPDVLPFFSNDVRIMTDADGLSLQTSAGPSWWSIRVGPFSHCVFSDSKVTPKWHLLFQTYGLLMCKCLMLLSPPNRSLNIK